MHHHVADGQTMCCGCYPKGMSMYAVGGDLNISVRDWLKTWPFLGGQGTAAMARQLEMACYFFRCLAAS